VQASAGAGRTLVNNVRIKETINGRSYVIEVLAVSAGRWRAQLTGRPGATNAVMPFYGKTPQEAAGLLTVWLTRANRARTA
jgi:hypothetical protein